MNKLLVSLMMTVITISATENNKYVPSDSQLFLNQTKGSCVRLICELNGDSLSCDMINIDVKQEPNLFKMWDSKFEYLWHMIGWGMADYQKQRVKIIEAERDHIKKIDPILRSYSIPEDHINAMYSAKDSDITYAKRLRDYARTFNVFALSKLYDEEIKPMPDTISVVYTSHEHFTMKQIGEGIYKLHVKGTPPKTYNLYRVPLPNEDDTDTNYYWVFCKTIHNETLSEPIAQKTKWSTIHAGVYPGIQNGTMHPRRERYLEINAENLR